METTLSKEIKKIATKHLLKVDAVCILGRKKNGMSDFEVLSSRENMTFYGRSKSFMVDITIKKCGVAKRVAYLCGDEIVFTLKLGLTSYVTEANNVELKIPPLNQFVFDNFSEIISIK